MFPEFGIKELDEDSKMLFFEQFCQRGTWKEIRNKEVYEPLTACYSDEDLRVLDEAVPERMSLGSGKRYYDLDYSKGTEVILRAKLQDFYDIEDHPSIVFGKYPLIIELLAPNQRPIQRTSDLLGFWTGSYLMVRKELAGRYPKHEWR